MVLVNIDTLLPRLVPELPGASLPLITQYTNRAVRDLLLRIPLWQAEITIDAVEDQTEYEIDLSATGSNLVAHDVLKLEDSDNNELAEALYHYNNWKLVLDSSLTPEEAETGAWTALVHVVGDASCTLFPDNVFARFEDAIVGRVFEKMCRVPVRPWSNPVLFDDGRREYRRGVQRAMIAMDSSNNTITG